MTLLEQILRSLELHDSYLGAEPMELSLGNHWTVVGGTTGYHLAAPRHPVQEIRIVLASAFVEVGSNPQNTYCTFLIIFTSSSFTVEDGLRIFKNLPRRPSISEIGKKFYLKIDSTERNYHNSFYVYGYHSAAGMNDAVLSGDFDDVSPAFMNGTYVQFALDTLFPWGLAMQPVNYAAWKPVQIDAGYGEDGFFVNGTGLQWEEQAGFGGWLICDWYHNASQLFYMDRYHKAVLPKECGRTLLQVEYIE
ncbi:hypothetical protein FE257_004937 [Aspergillus nanangensis]|uniref:DUF7907 domain-containing protein n=1 Tax=Aspergillus nanangensis TaxID=2582783 RepID=A0AAD4GN02_ASPNN|nr:hypothetical protein FE257_004937 [Aspergillus nanangensis]